MRPGEENAKQLNLITFPVCKRLKVVQQLKSGASPGLYIRNYAYRINIAIKSSKNNFCLLKGGRETTHINV